MTINAVCLLPHATILKKMSSELPV